VKYHPGWRFRLGIKVAAAITLFFALAFALVTPLIVQTITRQQKQSLINQTKSFTVLATQPIGEAFLQYRDSGTNILAEQITTIKNLYSVVTAIRVYDIQAAYQFSTDQQQPDLSVTAAATFEPIFTYDQRGFLRQVIYPFIQKNGVHRYTVTYDVSPAAIQATLDTLENNIIIFSVLTLVLADVLFVSLVQYLLVRPLKRMSGLAAAIRAGQYDASVSLKRNDEIGDLGMALNAMAATLKADIAALMQAEKLKSEFLIISSHNLRTPLTVIAGYLDLLGSLPLDKTAKGYLTTIQEHTSELNQLTNDMLTVAELEGADKPKLKTEVVNLTDFMQSLVPDTQARLSKKSQELVMELKRYLQTAVWNIIDNAAKFTAEKGVIKLSLQQDQQNVRLSVRDNGIGIPPAEVAQLFTKFHRGTSIMQYEYEGVGLGLYMTKLMVELMGGRIEVSSTVGQGSNFTIVLPKGSPPPAL